MHRGERKRRIGDDGLCERRCGQHADRRFVIAAAQVVGEPLHRVQLLVELHDLGEEALCLARRNQLAARALEERVAQLALRALQDLRDRWLRQRQQRCCGFQRARDADRVDYLYVPKSHRMSFSV
ncbi:hypothetical protein PQR51_30885 [Caballeronia grimmiae]